MPCSDAELTPQAKAVFLVLDDYARTLLESGAQVSGDGSLDQIVDAADILHWWRGHSVYDFNNDGITDGADLAAVLEA